MLAGGDEEPLGRLFLQRGIAPIIVGGERFLDPFEPALVPGAVGEAGRIVEVEAHPAVVHQPEIVAAFRAHVGERSEEHTSELQSLMRISYAVFCLKKKTKP